MEIPAIVQECKKVGVKSIAITDHLNRLEFLPKHRPILSDIQALSDPGLEVYFGVELNFTGCDEGFVFNEEIKAEYGFQFAIGGIHSPYVQEYDLKKIIDVQHRHHLKTCEDRLVDVLVHPYWFSTRSFEVNQWPWFSSMRAVPRSYVRELAQVARETGTAIEINASANLEFLRFPESYVKEYLEYLGLLAEEGVTFSLASDAHDIGSLQRIRSAWKVIEDLRLPPERVWRPRVQPLKK
ncbi:MAG: putative hydrolase [candidate division TA06 bacterium ADurb.Bin417]|uniref:Putative hydrolase n=1 Tax=candidate division TA06 bacterium ADurb.Bin417 TaxID=1852828 RepID=A0A1V5MD61_UNCT6|nr:MAG: putative hydrolase [candidate division TA06 bacterium ADurb.Bin417]